MYKPVKPISSIVRLSPSILRWVILGLVLGLVQVTGMSLLSSLFSDIVSPNRLWYYSAYEVFVVLSSVVFPFVGGFIGQADLANLPARRIFVWTFVGCLAGTALAAPFLSSTQTQFGTPSIEVLLRFYPGYLGAYGWAAVANLFGDVLLLLAFPFYTGALAFVGAALRVSSRRSSPPTIQ